MSWMMNFLILGEKILLEWGISKLTRACVRVYMHICGRVYTCVYICVHTYISFVFVYVLVFPSPNFPFHFVRRKKSSNRKLRYTKKTLKTHTFAALLLHPPRLWTHTIVCVCGGGWKGWKVIQGQVCNHNDTDDYKYDNDCHNDAKNMIIKGTIIPIIIIKPILLINILTNLGTFIPILSYQHIYNTSPVDKPCRK